MLTLPRSRSMALTGIAVALTLVGCGVESTATPTATAITPTYHPSMPQPVSDEDVEAAITGFEQYVAALNRLDPADRSTIDAFLATTSGEQLRTETEFIDVLVSQHWTIEGAVVARFIREAPEQESAHQVDLEACVDASELHYFDAAAVEHGPSSEERIQMLHVRMRNANSSWLVDQTSPLETGASSCE